MRKKKQIVKFNNLESLEGLCQETYNDSCLQIIETQKNINELGTIKTVDIDDIVKITREKANLLKIKESAIRIKIELSKIMNDSLKNNGDIEITPIERAGQVTQKDLSTFKKYLLTASANGNQEQTEFE